MTTINRERSTSAPPPTPRVLQNSMTLGTLLNLMSKAKRADDDVHNYAKGIFKPTTKIIFKRNGTAHYATIVEVTGTPGRTRLMVEKITTLKRLEIRLEDVTGIVQES